jgi:hypothetical protein
VDALELLSGEREGLLDEALGALSRARAPGYREAGLETSRERLGDLLDATARSLATMDLSAAVTHAERVAGERFEAGFELGEIQTAYNVLEEVLWRRLSARVPPGDLGRALGLVSTVLGSGKDAVARTYVRLASRSETPSLDLRALFRGTDAPS